MNHLLKRQSSPCAMVECLFSNSKQIKPNCSCPYYFRFHPVFRNDVPKVYSSNYISALKLQISKKKVSKKNDYISMKLRELKNSKKMLEVMKVIPFKKADKRKAMNTNKVEFDECKKLIWRHSVNCTKYYDPNLFNCNLAVENFYKHYGKKKFECYPSSSSNLGNLENLKIPVASKNFHKDAACVDNGDLEETQMSKMGEVLNIQDDVLEEEIHRDIISPDEIKEINDNVPIIKTRPTIQEKDKFTDMADLFQKHCVVLNQDLSILEYLHSSIDIHITSNKVMDAFHLLDTYRKRVKWKKLTQLNHRVVLEIYNCLLYAFSCKGYWHFITTLTSWMEVDEIKLNSESFAAHLHCLANIKGPGMEDIVEEHASKVLNMIFRNNILLSDIICKTKLTKEASEKVLAIIRRIVPSYEIEPVITELSSTCALVKNLQMGVKADLSNTQLDFDSFGPDRTIAERLVSEQSAIEKNLSLKVKAVSSGRRLALSPKDREKVEELKVRWRESLTDAIARYQKTQKDQGPNPSRFNIHLYLNCLPVEKYVDILMETTLNVIEYSGGYSPRLEFFRRALGTKVFQCYQLRKNQLNGYTEKTENLLKEYVSWYLDPSGPTMNCRQKWQMLLQDFERRSQLGPDLILWPDEVKTMIGAFLLDIMFKNVTFTTNVGSKTRTIPVFYTILRFRDGTSREELKCHPKIGNLFEKVGFDVLHFPSEEVPMTCPPKPWRAYNDGGYIFLHTDFIRKPSGVWGKKIYFKNVPEKQLYAVMDALNTLQAVPWMINEEVLDVALDVFRSGGSERLSVPFFPEKLTPMLDLENLDFMESTKRIRERNELVKKLANNYGLWCEALYRLSLANHFRNKIFWLPQNLDFRGRVYPVPPLVNHLGSDLYRSLLIFAKGKPLGPKGLDWLKIHLINLTGTHKRKSVDERLRYANEILPDIIDSAEKPLTGNKWWMESEEPWQTLATCKEVKKALSAPTPEKYVCRFPVHQDGSCNGLQHYAALGRDLVGAKSVNLVPGLVPEDVYTVVAELVEKERAKDATLGHEIAQVLDGFVERKVVKQTVMTTVYGVTCYGAKLQIKKRLEEFPKFPREHLTTAAAYLTDKTFFCLRQMFTSAKEIQDWFINCANEICRRKDYVQWVSPLGLPVLQPYGKFKMNKETKLNTIVPDTMKQKNAFPPNFIHSLDSCHMMLTALYCEQAGLTFAAVHDCFWTHPSDVDVMNRICRDQFIELHGQSVLEDLSKFFKKVYVNGSSNDNDEIFEKLPDKGDFDVKEVMNSVNRIPSESDRLRRVAELNYMEVQTNFELLVVSTGRQRLVRFLASRKSAEPECRAEIE